MLVKTRKQAESETFLAAFDLVGKGARTTLFYNLRTNFRINHFDKQVTWILDVG